MHIIFASCCLSRKFDAATLFARIGRMLAIGPSRNSPPSSSIHAVLLRTICRRFGNKDAVSGVWCQGWQKTTFLKKTDKNRFFFKKSGFYLGFFQKRFFFKTITHVKYKNAIININLYKNLFLFNLF